MNVAGFVLAGGRSSRMGRDKALLPWQGATLLETAARKVLEAAGNVAILGDPACYGHFGFPVLADRIPDCGPLGGLFTALSSTDADWNLLVACDMPGITVELLRRLIGDAACCTGDALVPRVDGRWEPLCALYHRRLAAAAEAALQRKSLKMQEFVSQIRACPWDEPGLEVFRNVNTPEQYEAIFRP